MQISLLKLWAVIIRFWEGQQYDCISLKVGQEAEARRMNQGRRERGTSGERQEGSRQGGEWSNVVLKWRLECCQSGQEEANGMRQSKIELRGSEEQLKTTIFLTSERVSKELKLHKAAGFVCNINAIHIGFLIR